MRAIGSRLYALGAKSVTERPLNLQVGTRTSSQCLRCRLLIRNYDLPTRRLLSSLSSESIPRVAQPSIWTSIIPKFLRQRRPQEGASKSQRSKEWNPATYFIVIFMLIGSQAIQMIALRNGFLASSRKADAKISVLKDVIRRVQAGEEVDVEGILGTGDEAKEREWEEVLREIENEDALWQTKAKTARDQPRPNEGLHTPGELESQDSGSQKVNLEPNISERLGDSAGTRIGRAEGSQSKAPRGFY